MLRRALGLGQEQGWSGRRARRRSASDVFRPRQESASRGTSRQSPKQKPSDPAGTSDGWGQPNALVVSGGCDKELRIWDVKSGWCIYTLRGHTSTIRCLKVVHGRPIAITGSRDRTLRVWDIQRGRPLRVLEGHEESVRCLDVYGSHAVSGSYDHTCRLWDVDTGECLHVLRGHFDQVYCVAYDGARVVSGGLDTTVRIWDPHTG
ncbi:WD40 repeat-like protein [Wolfiporia cocos MD-104 SS10]|uniref:WD40 repeat-like protein n=1 Tax=Wolfiporia cocos (strain MD-104) TaxID=742152 RepID=A0A2H3JAA9_WOLCO|nr:WD40 repeat-like protein [Wolfiporia cocos MD-104 SS10]